MIVTIWCIQLLITALAAHAPPIESKLAIALLMMGQGFLTIVQAILIARMVGWETMKKVYQIKKENNLVAKKK